MIRALAGAMLGVLAFAGSARADDAAAPAALPTCTWPSDQHCAPFGMWSLSAQWPDLISDVGIRFRRLELVEPTSSPSGPVNQIARTNGSSGIARRHAYGVGGSWEFGVGLSRHLYLVFDMETDGIVGADSSATALTPNIYVAMTGVLGARTRLGPASVAAEVAGGMGMFGYGEDGLPPAIEPVVEVRGRAELWLNPWIDLGVMASVSAIHPGEWMNGVYVGFHLRSYARDRNR